MSTKAHQMIQSREVTTDQALYEKSVNLRTQSSALLWEARELRNESRMLKAKNALLAVKNPSPNAARKRDAIWAIALRFSSRPKINLSIDVRLHGHEQKVNIFDKKKRP